MFHFTQLAGTKKQSEQNKAAPSSPKNYKREFRKVMYWQR